MKFTFRDIEKQDIEWARLLHNDSEVLSMLTDPSIVSPEQQIEWFKKLRKSESSRRLVVEDEYMNKVGLIRLDQIDYHNLNVCVGMDICKEFRGQGYAKPIYKELFKYLFDKEFFNRLWLLVAEYNTKAYSIYKALGFKEEGRHRQALYKNSKFFDYVLMGLLKEEYVQIYI